MDRTNLDSFKRQPAKVYPGSKDEIDQHIDGILKHCKDMKKKNGDYSLMVIFDDIDVTKRNDKVAELFTQGRHYNTVRFKSLW